MSLPTQGAWIEILAVTQYLNTAEVSLPTQGAWIEIHCTPPTRTRQGQGRSLHRERGLKFFLPAPSAEKTNSRSLHRERGLKFDEEHIEWIESPCRSLHRERGLKSSLLIFYKLCDSPSLPTQGAWIEIIHK